MSHAILIRNLVPDQAEGVLRIIDLEQWTRAVTPPIRFSAVAMAEDRPLTDIRLNFTLRTLGTNSTGSCTRRAKSGRS
eukprot:9767753-Lingulodinium_polyedra.AAC.1